MPEQLYVDSSAAVKRYLPEVGADEFDLAAERAASLASCRIAFVEVGRALGRASVDGADRDGLMADWNHAWEEFVVVDVDQAVAQHAVALAVYHGLRSADAIHLASALALPAAPLRFATWDRRLWDAARAVGLRTVPAERP